MRGDIVLELRRAGESLSHSTDVRLEANGLRADVSGRCSPYATHVRVEYGASDMRVPGCWVAGNSRYTLMLSFGEEPESLPGLSPDGIYRQEWAGGVVPTAFFSGLIEEFGKWLGVKRPTTLGRMLWAYIARRVVGGWYMLPDDSGDVRPVIPVFELARTPCTCEPLAVQGSLRVYSPQEWMLGYGVEYIGTQGAIILNHTLAPEEDDDPPPAPHVPIGTWEGDFVWAVHRHCRPLIIASGDHPDARVELPAGDYCLMHRIPRPRGDID